MNEFAVKRIVTVLKLTFYGHRHQTCLLEAWKELRAGLQDGMVIDSVKMVKGL